MASQETREEIILLGQNLFFMGRVETVAEPLGYQVHQAQTEAGFWQSYDDRATSLVLVDLEGNEDTWVAVLAGLQQRLESAAPPPEAAEDRNGESVEGVRIVAFGPHEDLAAMERAKALGCHLTLNKGRFSATLPEIIGGVKAGVAEIGE